METILIVLRGNSASGKTTIAKRLQDHFGRGTLLVSQDVVRRDMLKVQDREGNLSTELIRQITEYGKGRCPIVILEGIFMKHRYEELLLDLIRFYDGEAFVYYFNLPFEKTMERHNTRPQSQDFGEASLQKWWTPKDDLGVPGEQLLTEEMSEQAIVELICSQVEEYQRGNKSKGAST
ncbi:kinase [Planococcus sp. CP5-4]|uniref:kinase n=1 Tax=unclassified Planococcus (in: firmicutes) TaxID=2662419 RepID=UPI001C2125F9|nr:MULTISPECIES: kinase [unclassified Planococcus (in: firmicutes)]MBU9675070.1 kinase [Planococcus sp. CP5-4_YE]MBV0910159.1 kinase [Planococcus sp. CP5-4_UN]MBW6064634.1 kinase [Planococcus sp. CP5-4]